MQKSAPYLVTSLLAFTIAALPGCASFSETTEPKADEPTPIAVTPTPQEEIRYADFEPEVLYQLLAAEIAAQRGRYDVTLVNYLQAAKTSKDRGVITRAMRIAQSLNADNAQQQLADLWLQLEPDNLLAHRVSAIQAVKRQDLETALVHMEHIMEQGEDADFDSLAAMSANLPPAQQRELLQLYERLAERHPDNPELEYSIALLLKITGAPEQALERIERLTNQQPNFQPAIALKGDLLYQTGQTKEALTYLTTNTRRFPANRQLGTLYGRILINEGELQAAQDEFERLVKRYPQTPGLRLSFALVALENRQPELAKEELTELIEQGHHTDEASYYLGRIEEDAGNITHAIGYYMSVEGGNYFFPALARASELQAETGELDNALAKIDTLRESNPEQAENFWLLEVNLLLDQQREQDAMAAANHALEVFPENIQIRYARAMLHDSLGNTEQAEDDLRAILSSQPDNAVALNALGYILTIRTERLDEARSYIEQALALDPDNPAILDSMGWVLFRQGDTEAALEYLADAWAAYPDPEVAAHYGEALWVTGNEEQARIVWEEGLEQNPDHDILIETIQRLTGNGNS
ncbi:MAG: tetratricopeptide repeat protein [Marinobacter sp.]|uniref:tetratricopeptide repeat protein n=1 Tax=Marinobacter sp. TaxID=50741 RepID=UPI0029C45CF8|nr:tetratricopeptide repeat protein [Marinobacter sp.]MDX5336741.1 tetratricopeptide repeat protein [Marinobacter sp.]MDX5387901.1 tetratricopeptide repeat protein [Marinobacter sp.]MDX5441664.1 tetratricopeptide repeat protein [Alteromonadaceae bacterium]MDX5473195.1 tetratricopeptide repeat protein [Marinobacter sp.]